MTTPSDAIMQDEQREELRRFLDKSRARFSKLLKRWSCGKKLFTPDVDHTSQESVTDKSNLLTYKTNKKTTTIDKSRTKELFPPSCATKNTLRMTAEDTEELLGMPYPGDARNIEDLQVNYTPAQRLALYADFMNKVPTPSELKLNALQGITDYDELNASRICESGLPKRRYRVSRPTFNEELHDLVELQMTALNDKNVHEQATNMRETDADHTNAETDVKKVSRNKIHSVPKNSCRDKQSSDNDTECSRSKRKSKYDRSQQSRREHSLRHKHKKRHKRSCSSNDNRSNRSPRRHRSSRTPSRHRSSRTPSRHRSSRTPSRHRSSRTPSRHRSSRTPSRHRRRQERQLSKERSRSRSHSHDAGKRRKQKHSHSSKHQHNYRNYE